MTTKNNNPESSPLNVLDRRMAALQDGDFAAIFHSYHPDSPFLQQFSTLDEYLNFADEMLVGQSLIESCTYLEKRVSGSQALILLHQVTVVGGNRQESVELAILKRVDREWLYHSSQRVLVEGLAISPQEMTIDMFGNLLDTVTF